ncbi:hypothetical protein C0991_009354 [Blastosporella zonata]|nr:hypothetical protein C0991_009354 [Blastosporella zonata]
MILLRSRCSALPLARGYSVKTQSAIVRSLNPLHLQPRDFVDISHRLRPTIKSRLKDGRILTGSLSYASTHRYHFPDKTHGFLYCHRNPNLPVTAGQVRFRLTTSADPASFEEGTDLMRHDGALPWSIPLLHLRLAATAPLEALAIQDGLIEPHSLDAIRSIAVDGKHSHLRLGFFLAYLEQPFVICLEKAKSLSIVIVTPQLAVHRLSSRFLLASGEKALFKGKLLVRFERTTLPDRKGKATIVMRVLKILEPVQRLQDTPSSHPIPTEGRFLEYCPRFFNGSICKEFDSPLLQLLPSILDTSYTPIVPLVSETPPSPVQSSNTGRRNLIPRSRVLMGRGLVRTLRTLDPRRLQHSDFIDLSGASVATFSPHADPFAGGTVEIPYVNGGKVILFPPGTQGFLYLHHDPRLPPLSAQIRLRITSTSDPAGFEKGTDLINPHGQPWNISTLQILHIPRWVALKDQLRDDGYEEIVQAISDITAEPWIRTQWHSRILYYLEQPFVMDVSLDTHEFIVVAPGRVERMRTKRLFSNVHLPRPPYTGTSSHPSPASRFVHAFRDFQGSFYSALSGRGC